MKKLLLLVAAALVMSVTNAQVFFTDSFTVQSLPGWTIVNQYAAGGSNVVWKWDTTASSAGTSAGTFNYGGATNGHIIVDSDNDGDQTGAVNEYTTITSSAISCTGKLNVYLSFYEFYTKYQADTVGVYVSNDSVNWNLVYDPGAGLVQDQATANPDFVETDITTLAANQPKVYIRFSWKGTWDYWWFVDNVSMRVPDSNDVQSLAIINNLSNGCNLTNAEPVNLTFRNHGLNAIDSVVAKYSINGGTPVSESVHLPNSLPADSSYTYAFTVPADLTAAGVYNIKAWVELLNDANRPNDTAYSVAISADPINLTAPYTMGFEVPNIGNEIGGFTWTTEDVNADNFTWNLSTNGPHNGRVDFRYYYNLDAATAADDWLFSPCLNMDASKAYLISFWDKTGVDAGGAYPESLEIKAGTTKASGGLTEMIYDFGAFVDSNYVKRKVAFKPASTGIYYIGFHAYSDPDEWFLSLDDVRIDTLAKPVAKFGTAITGNSLDVADSSSEAIADWIWNWGDGTSASNGQNPGAHVYASPGTYTVCLTVTNLAGTDSVCHSVTVLPTGINNADAANTVSIYPNPTNRYLNVMVGHALKSNAKIELTNILGETIMSRETIGNSVEKFDLDKLAQGVYLVRITGDGVKTIRKFVYAK